MEIELPNGNYLPLHCKALYRFEHTGIGVKFVDICQFEQELVTQIIASKLDDEGVPLQIDPFTSPPNFVGDDPSPRITDIRQKRDAVLQRIMSGGEPFLAAPLSQQVFKRHSAFLRPEARYLRNSK